MKILGPSAISGEIMDLITSAKKQIIIVSPYHEITGWEKIINKIKKAQAKGIKFIWYSRKNAKQKFPNELWELFRINPSLIDDLHAKLYMNEVTAVVTSLNLCKSSDEKSTDIGHITESQAEFDEIYDFYETYIKGYELSENPIIKPKSVEDHINASQKISKNISDSAAEIGIYEHITKKYGEFDYKLVRNKYLKYKDFIKPNFHLEFEFYEKALKILMQIPFKDLNKFEDGVKIKEYRKNLSCELDFWADKRAIKYFYKSNLIIKDWQKRQLDFFLKELDTVIEMTFSK